MNWEEVRGTMKQVGAKLKRKWSSLTDADVVLLGGSREAFLTRFQFRTGLSEAQSEREFCAFLSAIEVVRVPVLIHT